MMLRKILIRGFSFFSLICAFSMAALGQESMSLSGDLRISQMEESSECDSLIAISHDGELTYGEVDSMFGIQKSRWFLGKDTLSGIVFHLYDGDDGLQHGLIVSRYEVKRRWQSIGFVSLVGANRSWDGAYNTSVMINSPVADYALEPVWYIPSIDELLILYRNRFHVNKSLYNEGYQRLSLIENYWSSTESSETSAWTFYPFWGVTPSISKTVEHRVRRIRKF